MLRYLAFQVPGAALVAVGAWLAWSWYDVDALLAAGVVVAWVAKDAFLFPFVRIAYAPRDDRGPGGLRGARGVVVDALVPTGRVKIGGELWRARLRDGTGRVAEGGAVVVEDVEGLTVVVAPEESVSG